ncbi:DUF1501 domain-containing protein [Thalassoroseus pseudoceratinae]|uniref:DUF1501 domain-containing protein n=1 Tax=Thalassoroseus pseudoceratinae TaxID=2713176 RepID=UPI0014247554|nr:DUF1501 domain-containing protein [Thalassoroseus pseudoceratinae]
MNFPVSHQRRTFLSTGTAGIGAAVLASYLRSRSMAEESRQTERWQGVVSPLHHAPRAKRIIYLGMAGGPSHLETLDDKPKLAEMHGKPMPAELTKGQPIAQLQGRQLKCFAPQVKFQSFGDSGQRMAEVFPKMGAVADDLCIVNSMVTEAINHDPAHTYMNTGSLISGRPSMGSWLNYGLGSENESLPGFVVLTSVGKFGQAQPIAARQWHSGFLPSRFQGVEFRSTGDPVSYVGNPPGVTRERQADIVQTVNRLNALGDGFLQNPEVATRIQAYETAFQMQRSIPELVDLSGEPKHIFDLYGTKGGDGSFAANCLLARRLAERGVRFVQLYHRAWDHHGGIQRAIKGTAGEVDQACAALITDLKQRDMLKDTLVIWGGEFGRTPMAQGNGRDHHIKGFSLWMAGGGIRGGITHGATDDFGYNSVENIVHVNDFHATILHLLGIDHKKLTFKFQGRDFRLTDVGGHVVEPLMA